MKQSEVYQMFDQISPTYDRINRILSMNQDRTWRRKVVHHLPPGSKLHLLDLATGTADQLIALLESSRSIESAVGIDLSREMLSLGERKVREKKYADRIELQIGDALAVPFEPAQFDACTFSFGIRNVKDPLLSLKEIHRVLKPKGRALILEFSLPKRPIRWLYLLYLRFILSRLGGFFSRSPAAYRYLNETIESFPSGERFLEWMKQAGFQHLQAHPMALGAVTLYVGEK